MKTLFIIFFPVFMRFLCLFCMMFHMFEGEYIQELFCSLCLRMFEKFIGSGLLHDLTLVDENNFVRYRPLQTASHG